MDNNQLQLIQRYFTGKPVFKAYLFGSFAREEATANSDVDILVELDYSQPIGLEFVGMALDLQDLLQREVDLVSAKAVSRHLKSQIDKEKILIYEKRTG